MLNIYTISVTTSFSFSMHFYDFHSFWLYLHSCTNTVLTYTVVKRDIAMYAQASRWV